MTAHSDADILEAIAAVPMTGSEIGKGFAPDHIKDRAGWGRKWLKRAQDDKIVIEVDGKWTATRSFVPQARDFTAPQSRHGFLNTVQTFLNAWITGLPARDYKAPHAPRGTPPRPHSPRHTRALRFCNH